LDGEGRHTLHLPEVERIGCDDKCADLQWPERRFLDVAVTAYIEDYELLPE
jgi:hypothetical protein